MSTSPSSTVHWNFNTPDARNAWATANTVDHTAPGHVCYNCNTMSMTPPAPLSPTVAPLQPPGPIPLMMKSSARPLIEMWKKQRPISLSTTPQDSALTAPEDPLSLRTSFWQTVAEGWCQDQLALANSTWSLRRTYYLQPMAPPISPSLRWEANTGEVSTTRPTSNAANAWPPSTTATATYSCFCLTVPQTSTKTSNSSPQSPTTAATKANTLSVGTLSMTSQKTVKKPKFPPAKPKKKHHPSSRWRYVTEAEWVQRQMMEEVFRVVAARHTHLGPHSTRHAIPYPQLHQNLTATGDTTTSPSVSLPPTGEVSPQPNMSMSVWELTPP
jgi:hypothetical protein